MKKTKQVKSKIASALELYNPDNNEDYGADTLLDLVKLARDFPKLTIGEIAERLEYVDDLSRYELENYFVSCVRAYHAFQKLPVSIGYLIEIRTGKRSLAEVRKECWGDDAPEKTDEDFFNNELDTALEFLSQAYDLIVDDSADDGFSGGVRQHGKAAWKRFLAECEADKRKYATDEEEKPNATEND